MYINKTKILSGQAGFAAASAVIFVALGILALIAASYYSNLFGGSRSLTASIGDFISQPNLEETVKTIVSDLGNIQARSKTGVDEVAWGVCFRNVSDENKQDIYEVVSNITSINNPCDIGQDGSIKSTIKIPGDVSITDPGQGGSRYVTFQKVTGEATSPSNLNFTFTDGKDSFTINITHGGIITYSKTGTAPSVAPVAINNTVVGSSSVPTAPSVPQNPGAASGVGKVAIAWSAPAFSGDSPIIEYRIYRSTLSNDPNITLIGSTPFPNTVFLDTNVINNVTYFYRVDARNSVGASGKSAQVFATPFASQPTQTVAFSCPAGYTGTYPYCYPSQQYCPSGYTGTYPNCYPVYNPSQTGSAPSAPIMSSALGGDRQVVVSWQAPTGGQAVTGYRLYYAEVSGVWRDTGFSGTGTSYTHSGLNNGTRYYYVVSAINSGGTSVYSNEISAYATGGSAGSQTAQNPCSSLAAPKNLTATPGIANDMALAWSAVAPISGCPAIVNYSVYRLDPVVNATQHRIYTSSNGATLTYTDTGLTSGKSYHYWVSAYDGSHQSDLSNQAVATAR